MDGESREEKEMMYRYWLHRVPGIGNKTAISLIEKSGSAGAVYETFLAESRKAEDKEKLSAEKEKGTVSGEQWRELKKAAANQRIKQEWEELKAKGIRMTSYGQEDYPKRLLSISDPPFILYYIGKLPEEETPALAVIGARECSEYGRSMAEAFGERIAGAGVNVISGMARGIDGISQRAALRGGGSTYAVLGCGVDICYPAGNRPLYEAMARQGGILSPYPPGTEPGRTLFPYRNQIVAGLSDGVLVIEARQKSGTLITVDMALEQGKDVYAVPGRLSDRLSDGCNYLIRQGAGIALTPEDVVAELLLLKNRQGEKMKEQPEKNRFFRKSKTMLREKEALNNGLQTGHKEGTGWQNVHQEKTGMPTVTEEDGILSFLDLRPLSVDEIYEKMKEKGEDITLPGLMLELIRLTMDGKVKQVGGSCFIKLPK